jgi:hypothetical protein
LSVIGVLAIMFVLSLIVSAQRQPSPSKKTKSGSCTHDDSGLKLPAGFCATVFAEGIGHARHLVVSPSGVVYVNTWSGDYYDFDKPHDGGFLVALQDKAGAGKADVIERFGETVQTGGAGGVGIGIYKGSIYAEINDRIVRYLLPADAIAPKDAAFRGDPSAEPDSPWGQGKRDQRECLCACREHVRNLALLAQTHRARGAQHTGSPR